MYSIGKTVDVPVKILTAMLEFASKDVSRPHINGVAFCLDGSLAATDGHTAVWYRSEDSSKAPGAIGYTFPVSAIEVAIAAAKGAGQSSVRFGWHDGTGYLTTGDCSKTFEGMQVAPPFEAVCRPESSPAPMLTVSVATRYLIRLDKLRKAQGMKDGGDEVALFFQGHEKPVIFQVGSIHGLIMPMRPAKKPALKAA